MSQKTKKNTPSFRGFRCKLVLLLLAIHLNLSACTLIQCFIARILDEGSYKAILQTSFLMVFEPIHEFFTNSRQFFVSLLKKFRSCSEECSDRIKGFRRYVPELNHVRHFIGAHTSHLLK